MGAKSGILLIFNLILGCYAVHNRSFEEFFSNVDHPGRVVGGVIAEPGSYPHTVALTTGLFLRSFFCGGSVIATRTVLTAAHCVDTVYHNGLTRSLRVIAGTNKWNQGGEAYRVSGNVTHSQWSPNLVKNDIAILHTSAAIAYSDYVLPVVVSFAYVDGGVSTKAAGWGRTSIYGPVSPDLLELTMSTVSAEQCARDVSEAEAVLNTESPRYEPDIELCTFHSAGRGLCRGDSGSALIRLDQGTQIGISSWGFPCARGAPDVHVRISAYEPWIQMNIRL